LGTVFFERHRHTGERFEFVRDSHWSATGHDVVFEAVMASRFMERVLANSNRAVQTSSGLTVSAP
jgi:hypothetical protein